jgi:hypothetical protein
MRLGAGRHRGVARLLRRFVQMQMQIRIAEHGADRDTREHEGVRGPMLADRCDNTANHVPARVGRHAVGIAFYTAGDGMPHRLAQLDSAPRPKGTAPIPDDLGMVLLALLAGRQCSAP